MFYVYTYTDPRNNEIFYVGKGKGNRAYVHLFDKKSQVRFHKKLRNMLKNNIQPLIQLFATTENEIEAHENEEILIELIGRKDKEKGPLLNQTDGGEGTSGYRFTEEQKAKVSFGVRTRKPLTDEMKALVSQKISEANKGRQRTEEHRMKLRLANLGRKNSPETIAKKSAAQASRKRKPLSPEMLISFREKKVATMAAWSDEKKAAVRLKQSLSHKGVKRGPYKKRNMQNQAELVSSN